MAIQALRARDVAQNVGCALGAIYNVFADLDALVLAVKERTLDMLEAEIARQPPPLKRPPMRTPRPPATPPSKDCKIWRRSISPSPPNIPGYGKRCSNTAVPIRAFRTPIWRNWPGFLAMSNVRSKFWLPS
jgi:AcrR family transcriptional regulator